VRVEGTRVGINAAVVSAELDDEAVLLNIDTGVYFGLDAIGHQIWQLLERSTDRDSVVQHLLAEYDVEPGRLAADVANFFDALTQKGLVRVVGA
jgi:uncharacterized NAD(P)/FAD-binding protein YdhS